MRFIICLCTVLAWVGPLVAQPSPGNWKAITFPDGQRLEFRAHFPPGFSRTKPFPVAMVFVDGAQDRAAVWDTLAGYWFREASKAGWVVILPVAPRAGRFHEGGERLLAPLLRNLRTGLVIEGNRIHIVGAGTGARSAFRVASRSPHEFASLTAVFDGRLEEEDLPRLPRLAPVKLRLFSPSSAEKAEGSMAELLTRIGKHRLAVQWTAMKGYDNTGVWKNLLALRKDLATPQTVQGAVSAAIDDWHDAAAKADAKRYFGAFAPEGVFMGTDATERWTVDAFRKWAGRYFERKSAWIFVPISRNVILSPDKSLAWFDEVLGSSHYGECRGTGVMRKVGEAWKVAHYNLTVPVPNDLLGGVVSEIRTWREALERGQPATESTNPITIYVVRHAEKDKDSGDGNPSLTEAGRKRATLLARVIPAKNLKAILSSEFKRTQETVKPAAKAAGVEVEIIPAAKKDDLVRRLRRLHPGASALVAGHSNTVPQLLTALGLKEAVTIADQEYDSLFVVTLDAAGQVHLQRLRFVD